MLKMRIGIGLFCEHLAKDNVEMIDVLDYYDYIEEDAWDHPEKSVDEIVSMINDYDMLTLICRDNNYEPPAKQWVKLVPSNGWPDIVANWTHVSLRSKSRLKSDANPDAIEDALRFLGEEELLWEFIDNEINRLENEIKQLKSERP